MGGFCSGFGAEVRGFAKDLVAIKNKIVTVSVQIF